MYEVDSRQNFLTQGFPSFLLRGTAVSAMASPDEVSIYSELLSNLGQVSVVVTLPSPADASTAAEVAEDGLRIRIYHRGAKKDLALPGPVEKPPTTLPILARGVLLLSWRLRSLPGQSRGGEYAPESHIVPWSAAVIVPGSAVSCRCCGAIVMPEGTVRVW